MKRIDFVGGAAGRAGGGANAGCRCTRVNKLITLKNADPNSVAPMFNQWGVSIVPNNQMKTLSISGPADKVAAVEAAIKQLDVAPKTIELTVYFVVGGDQPNLMGGAVPQDLRDVITQLKGAFTFKDYKMLDALTLRTQGRVVRGHVGHSECGQPSADVAVLDSQRHGERGRDDDSHRPHARRAAHSVYSPGRRRTPMPRAAAIAQKSVEYINSGIDQDVDVKEGQKVVVGRSSLEGPQQALFLILTAHVIQ